MGSVKYNLIRQAIIEKRCMEATYKGYKRKMCPHTLGKNKAGGEQALFYQYGGGSSSGLSAIGSPDNWRCLRIDDLSDLAIINGEWHTGPNHSSEQRCVAEVDIEIQY